MPRHDNQSEMNEVLMNVMTSLAEKSGKQFMTAVELRELMQATAVEIEKKIFQNGQTEDIEIQRDKKKRRRGT